MREKQIFRKSKYDHQQIDKGDGDACICVWIKTNGKYGHRNKSKQLNKYCSFIVLILLMFTLKELIHLFTSISSKRRNEWKPHNIGAAQDNNQ